MGRRQPTTRALPMSYISAPFTQPAVRQPLQIPGAPDKRTNTPHLSFVQLNFDLHRPAPGSLFTMSIFPRPITLLLLLQLVTYGSCIVLNNKADSGLGHEHEARLGYSEPLGDTSFLNGSITDPSILFARQGLCSNGVSTCSDGTTCDKCGSCCAGLPASSPCSSGSFVTCCTEGLWCAEGLECWFQIGGTRSGCCPPGAISCFAATFQCCNPGATCGVNGCTGTP